MKSWLYLLLGAALMAAAAIAARQYGIDVATLAGFDKFTAAITGGNESQSKPNSQAGQRRSRGAAAVETAQAETSQLSDDISAIGTLLSQESVAIAPETSGRVAKILFADGATVEAGAPLFQLDTELATAALSEAKARLELAEANFTRTQALRRSGNVAQSTFESAQTDRDVARAAVDSAEVLLKKLTISAPFSGTLGFRTISEGAYVTAGTPLVQLDKIDRLQLSFSVPELQQQSIKTGQTVEFSADAVPNEQFTATITAIDPSIDVNGRALRVRAETDNGDLKLRPGLLVRITVKGPPRQSVVVPEAAVVQRGDAAFIYTVADNKAKQVKVKLGKRMPGKVEVVEGIAAGDNVVTAGNATLTDGAAVEVVSTAASAE